eukprot:c10744_g1_i1 orf=413-856(-)
MCGAAAVVVVVATTVALSTKVAKEEVLPRPTDQPASLEPTKRHLLPSFLIMKQSTLSSSVGASRASPTMQASLSKCTCRHVCELLCLMSCAWNVHSPVVKHPHDAVMISVITIVWVACFSTAFYLVLFTHRPLVNCTDPKIWVLMPA